MGDAASQRKKKYRPGNPKAIEVREAAQARHKLLLEGLRPRVESRLERCDCPKANIDDFVIKGKLGKGGYGLVVQGIYARDASEYAIKIQRKAEIVGGNRFEMVRREKTIMYAAFSAFVVELKFTGQDENNIFMMMEYSPHRDLRSGLFSSRAWKPSESMGKLYAAQIVLALEFLHSNHILFRDLKPENCLIFPDGYLKLVDFGSAKVCQDETYSFCGSIGYIAPEVMLRQAYTKAADWYSFGRVVIELVTGESPLFVEEQPARRKPEKKQKLSRELGDFVARLSQWRPAERLGNFAGLSDDVKLHPWFADLKFQYVYEKRYKIKFKGEAYIPEVVGAVTVFGMKSEIDVTAEAFADF